MKYINILSLVSVLVLSQAVDAARLKDIASLRGVRENQLIGYLKDRGNFVIIDLLRNKISKNYTLNSHIEDLLIINNYVIYKSDIFIYYYNFKTNTFKLKIPLFLAGNYNFEIINLKKYSVKRFEFLTNTIRSINYKLEFGIFFKDFIK